MLILWLPMASQATLRKTAEGVAGLFDVACTLGIITIEGYLFVAMRSSFFVKMTPAHNGAVFLKLNGIAVKSWWHDALGFSNAIDVAANLVDHGFIPM